ncbi:MAG TPA: DNA polymerase I [Clostridiaceae bacterium]|nr:DNA polymerase I [Clostridiaceae bacterium]
MIPRKVMLIDGNSIINRAYYGLAGRQNLTASDGTPTGAVYAFLNMLLSYRDKIEPDMICTLFDRSEPTFRHEVYKEYKGDRKPMPDDLAQQIPLVKELLDALGVKRCELTGYEADDLIGTIAKKAAARGHAVTIVSGDKDLLQLIDDKTDVLMPLSRGGVTQYEVINAEKLKEKYGITPQQIIDLKALMGDKSDGIPGIRGIGEKTALRLLAEYGDLDRVLANASGIKGALGDKIRGGEEEARLSYELATIDTDVPLVDLEQDLSDMQVSQADDQLLRFFLRVDFKSMIERFGLEADLEEYNEDASRKSSSFGGEIAVAASEEEFIKLAKDSDVVVYWDEKLDNYISFISTKGHALHLPKDQALDYFADLTGNNLIIWDYKSFLRHYQRPAYAKAPFDLRIAAYLLDQIEGQVQLDHVLSRVLGSDYRPHPLGAYNEDAQLSLLETADGDAKNRISGAEENLRLSRAENMILTRDKQLASAKGTGLEDLLDLEFSLAGVLADMESQGITIDRQELDSQSRNMTLDIADLEKKIYALVGHEFNLNSPRQLGTVLFEELKLPPGRKTKTGQYSTAAEELESLVFSHEIVPLIIEHRSLAKLKSTFLDGLSSAIEPDGRVRTSYHQTLTSTGRLSSSNPNLQNIPIRTERGREIRNIFVASSGNILLDADYAQIELRILAHLSQDPELMAAFRQNLDVHSVTATSLFNVPLEEVTSEQRSVAKTVNFSIVYGISDFGLARDLGISVPQAHDYIAAYDERYSQVRAWLNDTIKKAYEDGYVETMLGRRRYVTELKSSNINVRKFGERAAANAPVQGTAADLIKIAMVNIDAAFKERELDARLVLQVHDELIVEASETDAEAAAIILQKLMSEAMELSVPLVAEVSMGHSWGEVKS